MLSCVHVFKQTFIITEVDIQSVGQLIITEVDIQSVGQLTYQDFKVFILYQQ